MCTCVYFCESTCSPVFATALKIFLAFRSTPVCATALKIFLGFKSTPAMCLNCPPALVQSVPGPCPCPISPGPCPCPCPISPWPLPLPLSNQSLTPVLVQALAPAFVQSEKIVVSSLSGALEASRKFNNGFWVPSLIIDWSPWSKPEIQS